MLGSVKWVATQEQFMQGSMKWVATQEWFMQGVRRGGNTRVVYAGECEGVATQE